MKKYLYIIVSLFCTLSACTDSNEIDIVQQNDVTFNVNVAHTYESWGLSSFKDYLGTYRDESVGIFTMIYDKNGQLCRKVISSTKTLQTISQNIGKLKSGEYNVVTIVTMIEDAENESPAWQIIDEEKLDKLMIAYKPDRSIAGWYEAFGLASASVTVGNNNSTINIVPEPVGSIITLGYENFDQAHFNYFSFSSRNNADGLRLTPNLDASDRYYIADYEASNVWGPIARFYSSSGELKNTGTTSVYTFETGSRPYLFGGAKSMYVDGNLSFDVTTTGTFDFEDGKEYIAFCYYVGYPDNFKTFLGSESEFKNWYSSLDKNINPIFSTPCTNWSSSVSFVKSYMQGYQILQDITEGNYGYYMAYKGKYCESIIEYDFETQSSGLESVYITIYDWMATASEIEMQLRNSGYKYEGYIEGEDGEPGYMYFTNENTEMGVFEGLTDYEGDKYFLLNYIPKQSDETRGVKESRSISNIKRINPSSGRIETTKYLK